jgi:hypothetical protein
LDYQRPADALRELNDFITDLKKPLEDAKSKVVDPVGTPSNAPQDPQSLFTTTTAKEPIDMDDPIAKYKDIARRTISSPSQTALVVLPTPSLVPISMLYHHINGRSIVISNVPYFVRLPRTAITL